MNAGKIILLLLGIIGLLASIGLLVGGGALLWADNTIKDSDGFYTTETIQIEKDSFAIVTGPADVDIEAGWDWGVGWDLGDLVTFKVGGSNNNPSNQIFIGVATESDVDAYLNGVEHDEIIDLNIYPYSVDYKNHPGNISPGGPTAQTFWTQSASGGGTQTLEWELETGSHSLVLMNADGSAGIDIDVVLGAKVPFLFGISVGLLVGGLIALTISVLMIYFVVRRPSVVTTRRSLKPGVSSSYENGWRQLWKYFLELFLIAIIGWLITLPTTFSNVENNLVIPFLAIFAIIYGIFVEGPVTFGVSYANLKAARGDKLVIADMFEAFRNYLNAVLASLLTGIIIAFGLVLLIVPGVIFACKLAFTPYLVVDRKMDVIEALKTSWRMTDGHALKVFGIALLAIPICIAGLLLFGVGIILSIMWINLAFASLYHSVSTNLETPEHQKDDGYLEIAKERYAKGEISKDEFEQLNKDLA